MTLLRHQMIAALQLSGMELRLHEALYLQPADIDGERRLVHVHRRTGAKDRYIPLPQDTLALLRTYWKTHQNSTTPLGSIPPPVAIKNHLSTTTEPMRQRSAQSAFRKATQRAGITKLDVPIPTLRHAYATHLLEAGINLLALPWGASVSRCLASIWRAAGAIGLDLLGAVHWQQL